MCTPLNSMTNQCNDGIIRKNVPIELVVITIGNFIFVKINTTNMIGKVQMEMWFTSWGLYDCAIAATATVMSDSRLRSLMFDGGFQYFIAIWWTISFYSLNGWRPNLYHPHSFHIWVITDTSPWRDSVSKMGNNLDLIFSNYIQDLCATRIKVYVQK